METNNPVIRAYGMQAAWCRAWVTYEIGKKQVTVSQDYAGKELVSTEEVEAVLEQIAGENKAKDAELDQQAARQRKP